MVSYKDEDHEMPPIGKLKDEEIAALAKWVEVGLPFPKEDEIHGKDGPHDSTAGDNTQVNERTMAHWAYVKPARHELPEGTGASHPVDRFILAGSQPPETQPARLRTAPPSPSLLRPHGLPPTPEEVEEFLNDKSEDAYEQVIDRLSPAPIR